MWDHNLQLLKDNAKNTNYKKQYWNLRLYGLALDRIKYVLELWEYTQSIISLIHITTLNIEKYDIL